MDCACFSGGIAGPVPYSPKLKVGRRDLESLGSLGRLAFTEGLSFANKINLKGLLDLVKLLICS